jgi:hypothetical protein
MGIALGFNALMILIAAGVLKKWIPVGFLSGLIDGLHYALGISTPTPAQVRRAVVIWIVSILVIVDMLFSLLRWVY